MRRLLIGLTVLLSLATSLAPVRADDDCGGWFQISCEDLAEERARVTAEHAQEDEWTEQDLEERRYEEAEAADRWADTHLTAEKAAAVYWRDAYVKLDPLNGTRTGRLGTPEGRLIYGSYTCDPEYADAQSGGCVPADRDYDCAELRSWGIVNIPIRKFLYPNIDPPMRGDWMLLDDDRDGMGCEFVPDA